MIGQIIYRMTSLARLFKDTDIIVRISNKWNRQPLAGFEQKNDINCFNITVLAAGLGKDCMEEQWNSGDRLGDIYNEVS